VRVVVLLGDGAAWIWLAGRTHRALARVQVVEILDFSQACEHLATVAQAVCSRWPVRAQAWLAAVRHRLRQQGPVPVLAALARLRPLREAAAEEVRKATAYVTTQAARMASPTFAAQGLPLGSGAGESACKQVVQQRQVQAGRRWGVPGSQQVASLRALRCSGRWTACWQTQPLRRLRLVPGARATVPTLPAPSAAPSLSMPAAAPTAPPPAALACPASALRIQTSGKAWWPPRTWRNRSRCHQRSA
jgi:hypothetical protein